VIGLFNDRPARYDCSIPSLQAFPEVSVTVGADGDDVGYSIAAIFCERFGLSDEHCQLYQDGTVVNGKYLKEVR